MVGKFEISFSKNGTCRLPFALNFSDCRAALDWILVTTWRASTKFKKLVNGKRISVPNVPTGKMGLPFQNFRLSREFSSGTNQKNVYHLHPNRNFREFVVNGKQRSLTRPHPIIAHDWSLPVALRVASDLDIPCILSRDFWHVCFRIFVHVASVLKVPKPISAIWFVFLKTLISSNRTNSRQEPVLWPTKTSFFGGTGSPLAHKAVRENPLPLRRHGRPFTFVIRMAFYLNEFIASRWTSSP